MRTAIPGWTIETFQQEYQSAMHQYLKKGDESGLELAYKLGRQGLEHGLGVIDLASMYHDGLSGILQGARTPAEGAGIAKRLARFFVESLSPFEMTHRGYLDAQAALLHLNETLEAEARRIAHALHDEAGQLMVTVHFALENLARQLPPGVESTVQDVRDRLTEVEQQLRRLSHELRPPMLDDIGLVPALDFMAQGVAKRSGLSIVVNGYVPARLHPMAEIALYRTVQEALTNVTKHAKARRVLVTLEERQKDSARTVFCSVKDDGIGFNTDAVSTPGKRSGLGLLGMQERVRALGGSLDICSTPGNGTELLIRLPQAAASTR